jgi:hypothetical protein
MASCSIASRVISRITDSVSLAAVADARARGCTVEMRSSGTLARYRLISGEARSAYLGGQGGHGPLTWAAIQASSRLQ